MKWILPLLPSPSHSSCLYIPFKFLTFLLLLILLSPQLSYELDIEWKRYNSRHHDTKEFIFESAKIQMPADHGNPSFSPKINIFVRKMCKGIDSGGGSGDASKISPDWNIIVLPGGPGQTSLIYEKTIGRFNEVLDGIGSYCLYAVDHRGVGRSSKFIKASISASWIENIQEYINNTNFPLKTCTIQNAAKDVLELAKMLQKSAEKSGKKPKMVLYGSSYGSMLAHRIITINPEMFDKAIFESYAVPERFTIDSDEGLLLSCKRSKTCTSHVGNNPEHLRNIVSFLKDEGYNECSKILHLRILQTKSSSFPGDGGTVTCLDISDYFVSKEYVKMNRFGISLLHHAWSCPDPVVFEKALNKFENMKKSSNGDSNDPSVENKREPSNVMEISLESKKSSSQINSMIRTYLHLSEISAPYYHSPPSHCRSDCTIGLNTSCQQLKSGKDVYDRMLINSFLYPYDTLQREASINTKKTKIYIIHGGEDLKTPARSAKREFDRIIASTKRLFIINNQGHAIAEINECSREIYDEIFREGYPEDTDHCIQEANKKDLTEENDLFAFKKEKLGWFWPSVNKELPSSPKEDSSSNDNPSMQSDWFDPNIKIGKRIKWPRVIALTATGILLLSGSVAVIVFIVRKRRRRSGNE